MAIGVFDSGVGGLTIHRALVDRLPSADLIFLGDQKNVPYGGRPGGEIVDLTRAGCDLLFDQGCSLVVLACNTAASIALRRLQPWSNSRSHPARVRSTISWPGRPP